jgi:hypothetical protein
VGCIGKCGDFIVDIGIEGQMEDETTTMSEPTQLSTLRTLLNICLDNKTCFSGMIVGGTLLVGATVVILSTGLVLLVRKRRTSERTAENEQQDEYYADYT